MNLKKGLFTPGEWESMETDLDQMLIKEKVTNLKKG